MTQSLSKPLLSICHKLLFAILLMIVIVFFLQFQEEKIGQVLFLDWSGNQKAAELMRTDINGSSLHNIGIATGTINWKKGDKRTFAVGCADKTKICIYSLSNHLFNSIFPGGYDLKLEDELVVPIACQADISKYGISSISWSSDGNKIAVVCQNGEKSNLCILGLDGTNKCWGDRFGSDLISRVDWSPNRNILVVDSGKQSYILPSNSGRIKVVRNGNIRIVNTDGTIIKSFIDGWSPAWSPDGDKIAFFRWSEVAGYPGIAVVDQNGDNFKWVYLPPVRGSGGDNEYYHPVFRNLTDCIGSSKISWDSSGKSIIVDASVADFCKSSLFRINVETGQIYDLLRHDTYIREPDMEH